MNLRFVLGSLCALLALASSPARSEDPQGLEKVWELNESLDTPESAVYHAATKSLFVSSIAGKPDARDGNGWISHVDASGKVIEAKWFIGLNAPKGLAISGDLLWVADIDRIVGISIKEKKARYTFTIEGAKFLNDTTVDHQGNIYVSDMMDNKVYKVGHKSLQFSPPLVYLAGESLLKNPNGLTFKDDHLIVGQWGLGIKEDFTTTSPGSLIEITSAEKGAFKELSPAVGNIDGVELWGTGFLYSDYIKGTVGYISAAGSTKELLTGTPTAADIGISSEDKLVFVPVMNKNLLVAYRIK